MENLGRVADLTGGKVDIVNPLELTKNFNSILADPVIATNVRYAGPLRCRPMRDQSLHRLVFVLHSGMKFREESAQENVLERDVGNVSANTDIAFEYSVRKEFLQNMPEDGQELPFQVQIHYEKVPYEPQCSL